MTVDQAIQLGLQHHNSGRLQQAEQLYRQVLQQNPNHAEAMHLLGVLAQQVGQLQMAVELISRAIAVNPSNSAYQSNLAEALRLMGRPNQAEPAARRAIELEPNSMAAHVNLGAVLNDLDRIDEAAQSFRRAVELGPTVPEALTGLANALLKQGDVSGAIEYGKRAVEIAPDHALSQNNFAAALEKNDQLDEAETHYRRAIELSPKFAPFLTNYGTLLGRKGDLRQGMKLWEQALEVQPNFHDALWNIGLADLTFGQFERGWELYERRFTQASGRKYLRHYKVPKWEGQDISGKSILLYPEQGYGDVIMFARFIPRLADMGARVILHMPSELHDLMNGVRGVSQIVGENESLPPFDTYQALLSLPRVMKTTLATLPVDVPYINIDPARVENWAQHVKTDEERLKVGLFFKGRATPDPRRSVGFADLAPLADAANVAFFSLQLGDGVSELKDAPSQMNVVDLSPHIHDFADTAAAIANLDLLISIDTAAAHLAGAIGAKVWTMIPFAADFRWMLDRDDCPWYPTMRLFRQTVRNDWPHVVARVRDELMKLSKQ